MRNAQSIRRYALPRPTLLCSLLRVVDLPQLSRIGVAVAAGILALGAAPLGHAADQPAYRAIDPTLADKTVTLTGHDLNLEQVIAVARGGEKVELSPEVLRHQDDTYRLLLEGAAEGLPITGFNRDADGKATFEGDPTAPETAATIGARQLAVFTSGTAPAGMREIADEETVRAVMVVRANTLPYSPASTPVTTMLLAFLNNRITPVATPGGALKAIAAAMVGNGDVYHNGVRTTAERALADSGLMPLAPAGMDEQALTESGAEQVARAAVLAADGARALDWADVIFAIELAGTNANVAAFSLPAQANRPFQWLNWEAFRILDMLKGSYLLADDPGRLRALPDALRTLPGHQGAAWMAWGALRTVVLVALNASDQTLAVRVDLSQRESPELSSAQMKKFLVRGSRANGGHRGYIVETVNSDPSPVAVSMAGYAFALETWESALANASSHKVPEATGTPDERASAAIDGALHLLAGNLVTAAAAVDQRLAENQDRDMGDVINAAMTALRGILPAGGGKGAAEVATAYDFLMHRPITDFCEDGEPPPGSDDPIPLAQERLRR